MNTSSLQISNTYVVYCEEKSNFGEIELYNQFNWNRPNILLVLGKSEKLFKKLSNLPSTSIYIPTAVDLPLSVAQKLVIISSEAELQRRI